ncbi:EF-hand calcium-binding domain-containing protein 12 isoform X2 [Hemicordylus capensis]|uniref:EF-hand calcium-binding domain-containing protein 12 isoform X2 n=1 Tax=Hemicordylus capensis TaxID=884348 RepID=UPI0023044911|nr:EF-hand calcium-binding domain-containing protein 12 isoform X2 [Hemicordylus capensis]
MEGRSEESNGSGRDTAGTLLFGKNSIMSSKGSLEESPEDNVDEVNKALEHCFKQFKFRETHPHVFFKVKASRFGPARSRRRILIAPPMKGMAPTSPKPHVLLGPKEKEHTLEERLAETTKDELQDLEAWIQERKKLWDLLNNCVNLEKWLEAKQPVNELEASVLGKIRECKEMKMAKTEAQLTTSSSTEHLMPKREQKRVIPLIHAPYPESLITLQNILHKHKLKLVDIFSKVDKSRTMKFKRADFLKVLQATKVPISNDILEDVVIYLTSTRKGNYITNDDLVECQKIWLDNLRDQWRSKPESSTAPEVSSITVKTGPSAHTKIKDLESPVPKKPSLLEVPPINTEIDAMHLTYNQMEMVGKRYKEMRRQLKRKIDPIEWLERCRMVRSGDPVVDGHCLPSTIEGEMGEVIDQYRLAVHLVYTQCVKLCEAYGVPLTERLLKRALLYPGDRILTDGKNYRKMRQPGGYYSSSTDQGSSKEQSRSSSREIESKPIVKAKKKRIKKTESLKFRWKSYEEFSHLMRGHYNKMFLPLDIWSGKSPKGKFPTSKLAMARHAGDIVIAQDIIEREMKRIFAFLNPMTDSNSFWPGHLLEKLRLYLPQMERDGGHAIFHRVSHTRPVYPGTYNPYRNWPVNEQGYVTYGESDSKKDYYYI